MVWRTLQRGTRQLRQQLQACSGMGQQFSRENARLEELKTLIPEAQEQLLSVIRMHSDQAVYEAARDYYHRLCDEQHAIIQRMCEYLLVQPARGARSSWRGVFMLPGQHSPRACSHQHALSWPWLTARALVRAL